MPERPTLDDLYDAAQACRGCELYRDTTQAVVGAGAEDAELVLVGEQPGDAEDREGRPFVGPAGRLLGKALAEAGIDRASTYETNVVKHFGHHLVGKRRIHDTPKVGQVRACAPWLRVELDLVRPQGVVLLGATAAKAVLGTKFRITESRGVRLPWPEDYPLEHPPEWALATLHPSAILRSREREAAYEGLVRDLRVVAEPTTTRRPHIR